MKALKEALAEQTRLMAERKRLADEREKVEANGKNTSKEITDLMASTDFSDDREVERISKLKIKLDFLPKKIAVLEKQEADVASQITENTRVCGERGIAVLEENMAALREKLLAVLVEEFPTKKETEEFVLTRIPLKLTPLGAKITRARVYITHASYPEIADTAVEFFGALLKK